MAQVPTLTVPDSDGTTFLTNLNNQIAAAQSGNSGTSDPTAPVAGMLFLDTTANPNILKIYDGAAFVAIGSLDTSSDIFSAETSFPTGTSRPASVGVGGLWIDSTNDPSFSMKYFDGTNDITVSGAGTVTSVASGTGLTGGPITGSGSLAADFANQSEAETGTDTTKVMNPLRTAQAIAALSGGGGGGAWEIVSVNNASNSTSVDITGFESGYDYLVNIDGYDPASNGQELQMLYQEGGTFQNTLYEQNFRKGSSDFGYSTASHLKILTDVQITDGEAHSVELLLINPMGLNKMCAMLWSAFEQRGATPYIYSGGGTRASTANQVTGARFLSSSGNINSGTFTLYRRTRSV